MENVIEKTRIEIVRMKNNGENSDWGTGDEMPDAVCQQLCQLAKELDVVVLGFTNPSNKQKEKSSVIA